MNEDLIETKLQAARDMKQFAKAEMARDLARRHGKQIRMPWDEERQASAPEGIQLDEEALRALVEGGGD
jgi:hypothetical protein